MEGCRENTFRGLEWQGTLPLDFSYRIFEGDSPGVFIFVGASAPNQRTLSILCFTFCLFSRVPLKCLLCISEHLQKANSDSKSSVVNYCQLPGWSRGSHILRGHTGNRCSVVALM